MTIMRCGSLKVKRLNKSFACGNGANPVQCNDCTLYDDCITWVGWELIVRTVRTKIASEMELASPHKLLTEIIMLTLRKGRVAVPKQMNFRKSSKRPLTATPYPSEWSLSLEIMCMYFILSGPHTYIYKTICGAVNF